MVSASIIQVGDWQWNTLVGSVARTGRKDTFLKESLCGHSVAKHYVEMK